MRASISSLLLVASLSALAACGGDAGSVAPAAAEAPVLSPSDFSIHDLPSTWRDQDGAERTLASTGGRVRVVAMTYTRCAHTCPLIVAEMKRLEASLTAEERARVGFVLVSLDPARDGPAEMKTFADATRLDPSAWTLLTGDDDAVRELAVLLRIRYRAEENEQISHSNTYLVLDGEGRVVHRQDGLGTGTEASLAVIRAAAAAID